MHFFPHPACIIHLFCILSTDAVRSSCSLPIHLFTSLLFSSDLSLQDRLAVAVHSIDQDRGEEEKMEDPMDAVDIKEWIRQIEK